MAPEGRLAGVLRFLKLGFASRAGVLKRTEMAASARIFKENHLARIESDLETLRIKNPKYEQRIRPIIDLALGKKKG